MQEVVIVAATRTAIGSFQGALAGIPAVDLGAAVIRRLLQDTGLDGAQVDEVILGHVLTAGAGQNPARQAAIKAGLPVAVPALTLNKVCGSGLKALHLGVQAIRCGDAEVIIAGGMENMSLAPYVMPGARTGLRMGHAKVIDSMIEDGLWDAFNDYHMGITAENLVDKYQISREQQDAFGERSHRLAHKATVEWLTVVLAEEAMGGLDVLVNNAGISQVGKAGKTMEEVLGSQMASIAPIDEMKAVWETNVFGTLAVTQAFLPLLRKASAARIVAVSSALGSLGLNANPANPYRSNFDAVYGASKTALNGVFLSLANELESSNIKVHLVSPGFTATALNNFQGTDSVEEGSAEPIRVALAEDLPNGSFTGPADFSSEGNTIPW